MISGEGQEKKCGAQEALGLGVTGPPSRRSEGSSLLAGRITRNLKTKQGIIKKTKPGGFSPGDFGPRHTKKCKGNILVCDSSSKNTDRNELEGRGNPNKAGVTKLEYAELAKVTEKPLFENETCTENP